MLKRNKKLTFIALAAMLFMAVAVTFLSFSHADEDGINSDELELVAAGETAVSVSSKTNVDYIIQNANSTDPDVDTVYHIVEIYSGSQSALGNYVSNKYFSTYVLDGYRTAREETDPKMVPEKVEYKAYKTTDVTNANTAELYNILHTYAVGDYKPIIFNTESTVGGGGSSGSSTAPTKMSDLVSGTFSSGAYYYTFAWDKTKSDNVTKFLDGDGSLYLGINGTKQQNKGKWLGLTDTTDGSKKNLSKFLVEDI